jgi:hypothetical protein
VSKNVEIHTARDECDDLDVFGFRNAIRQRTFVILAREILWMQSELLDQFQQCLRQQLTSWSGVGVLGVSLHPGCGTHGAAVIDHRSAFLAGKPATCNCEALKLSAVKFDDGVGYFQTRVSVERQPHLLLWRRTVTGYVNCSQVLTAQSANRLGLSQFRAHNEPLLNIRASAYARRVNSPQ